MARIDKNFNIPTNSSEECDYIRETLINKMNEQKSANNFSENNSKIFTQQQNISNNPKSNLTFNNVNQNYNSTEKFKINRDNDLSALNNYNYNNSVYTDISRAGRTSVVDDFATASHSIDEVKYKPKSKNSIGKTLISLIIMITLIFTLSWLLREFVFNAYEIPSASMEKTIMTGDMVFAEKISTKFNPPTKGQIITFDDPLSPGRTLIKRVIATEGQVVNLKNGKLYIDGQEQNEPYVNGLPTYPLSSSKINFPYTVPEDCTWVMGDNRINSQDSRYFGAIPNSSVIGRGLFVYWPFDDIRIIE